MNESLSHQYRYFFSPRIAGSINVAEATLALATCCITYLCQMHHGPESLDREIADNILSGAYRFHDFSTTMWFGLVENYARLTGPRKLSDDLIGLLETLTLQRINEAFISTTEPSYPPNLEPFKKTSLDLHGMLCKVANFRRMCSRGDFNKSKGTCGENEDLRCVWSGLSNSPRKHMDRFRSPEYI